MISSNFLFHKQDCYALPKTETEVSKYFQMLPGSKTYRYRGVSRWNPEFGTLCRIVGSATRSAGKDYAGFKLEVLKTMKVAEFDVVNDKIIDLKSKNLQSK
jgi:hypothetical protein